MKKIFLGIFIMLLVVLPIGALAGNGTVIISIDDGWQNTFAVAKSVLDANGQKAVVFVIPEAVNGGYPDYMTLEELKTLYNNGWDISSHSYTHGSAYPEGTAQQNMIQEEFLVRANNSELKYELGDSKAWLDSNGFTKSSMFFAYPFGAYNNGYCLTQGYNASVCGTNDLPTEIKNAGYYVGARTIDAYSWRYDGNHPPYKKGDADALEMATLATDDTPNSYPQAIMDEINKTINENGLLILTFHKIVTGDPANAEEYNLTNFTLISNYLKNATDSENVTVQTFSQYFGVPNPIPIFIPPTPSEQPAVIGEDWINVTWSDGIGINKTDVFDVNVKKGSDTVGTMTYNVVNRSLNITGLTAGMKIIAEVTAINRSWGTTSKSGLLTITNSIPQAPLTFMPPIPLSTTITGSKNLTWTPGSGNATDYFNVNINNSWTNGTLMTFYDTTSLPPDNYIVKVYAVNTTNGTLINNTPLILSSTIGVPAPPSITSVTITPTNPSAGDEINITVEINNPGASFNGRVEGNVWSPSGTGKYLGWETGVISSGVSTVTIIGPAGGERSSYISHEAGTHLYDVFLENVDKGQVYTNSTDSKTGVAFTVGTAASVYISNVVLSSAPKNGSVMTLNVTISNPTVSAFAGTMDANIWDSVKGYALTPKPIIIAAGSSTTLTFSYTPVNHGLHSYDFFMVNDISGQNTKAPWGFSCMDYVAGIGFTVV